MRILALDPGETTGWARVDTITTPGSIHYGRSPGWTQLQELIFAPTMSRPEPSVFKVDVVVIEKFTLYPWAARSKVWSEFPTVEVIGVAKYLAAQAGARVVMQGADVAKAKWLKKAKVKGNAHERDAQRHLLAFLKREGLDGDYREFYPRARRRKAAPD